MLLRRSKKKKQKKALLEAQQAAAMQGMMLSGGQPFYPRPTSTLSVPAITQDGSYEVDQLSGGSDELDMMESMSLTGEYSSYTHQIPMTTAEPVPYFMPQQSLPTPTQLIGPPPIPQPAVMTTSRPAIHEHSLRRGISQPTIANIATVAPPIMASTFEYPPIREQPVLTTVTTSGTIPRSGYKKTQVPKIDPVKAELIKTSISLGLGRGIDATNKSPWTEKSAFQVRRIHQSIVETNEGGIVSSYEHELMSITDMDELFQTSLNPPEIPVTIHVEGDSTRSISSSRQIIGKRVLTRTIGFQTDTEERYTDGENTRNGKDSNLVPRDPTEVVYNTQNSCLSFEERVYQWLLHRLVHKCTRIGQRLDLRSDESYADQLTKLLHSNKSLVRVDDEVKAGCQDIIKALRVTHYITGISLGAAEYRVMSDGEYHKQLAQGGAFGLDTLADAAMNGFTKQSRKDAIKTSTKMSHVRKIGTIGEHDKVERGTTDEVVLAIQVQPITRLIRIPAVKVSLFKAIESYMERTAASEGEIIILCAITLHSFSLGGPFIIKCTGRDIYLTVNKFNNFEVEGTEISAEASLFYFQSTDDGGNPFDFHIVYYGEDVGPGENSDKTSEIGRYLETCSNTKGYCPGPLLMKHSVKVRDTRFTLRSRLSKKYSKSHLSEWIAGEDAFYISCSTRKFKHDSYLAVKNSLQTDLLGKHFFITEGLPNIHLHNGDNTFMLFQILQKEALAGKAGDGRETPGKLPVLPSEITTREPISLM